MSTSRYAISIDLPVDITTAREAVTRLLAAEGFGILTEIDVAATLKRKIDADVEPYLILGACNPRFALQALAAEESLGILLPCNVALKQINPQCTRVWLTRVEGIFSLVDNPGMADIAATVDGVMARVATALAAGPAHD